MDILSNAPKLKGTGFRIAEDYSTRVRSLRRKLWEATSSHRSNGSTVKIRFDHVYIDGTRHYWDTNLNMLVKSRVNVNRPPSVPASVQSSSSSPS